MATLLNKFPLVQIHPSFIKDTTNFLLQLEKLEPLPDNSLLVTLKVSSLYTNIPRNEGVDACRYFLKARQDRSLLAENICDLIRMILTMTNFSFDNEHYLQNNGTAMGTRMALRKLIDSWVNLDNRPLTTLYSSQPFGGGSSMISSDLDTWRGGYKNLHRLPEFYSSLHQIHPWVFQFSASDTPFSRCPSSS